MTRPGRTSHRMVLVLFLVVVMQLAATSTSAAEWTQHRGGADRAGQWTLATGELDVAHIAMQDTNTSNADRRWLGQTTGVSTGILAVEYDGRWWGVDNDGSGCRLISQPLPQSDHETDTDSEPASSVEIDGCHEGRLQGFDAGRGRFFVCMEGPASGGILLAVDPNGRVVWTQSPPTPLAIEDTDSLLGQEENNEATDWTCTGTALAPEREILYTAYLPVSQAAANQHAIVAHNLATGAVQWTSRVTPGDLTGVDLLGQDVGERPDAHFYPHGITATATGLIVTGEQGCPQCSTSGSLPLQRAVAWFSSDGTWRGVLAARTTTSPDRLQDRVDAPNVVSDHATATGSVGALVLGDQLLQLNPDASEPGREVEFATLAPDTPTNYWPTGAWIGDTLIIPTSGGITAYDDTFEPRWTWAAPPRWVVHDLLADGNDVFALMADEVGAGDSGEAILGRIGLDDGRLRAETPLPFTVAQGTHIVTGASTQEGAGPVAIPWHAQLVPLTDGDLLVIDMQANAVRLASEGARGVAPSVQPPSVSNTFPAVGSQTSVDVDALLAGTEGSIGSAILYWGDDESVRLDDGRGRWEALDTLTHAYDRAGDRTIRFVVANDAGFTATATTTVHVGATPPPELTLIQQIVAPENYDLVFGLLGILIAVVGGLWAYYRSRRKADTIESYLQRIDTCVAESRDDPADAIEGLDVLRQEIRHKLAKGRLDDSQFGVLDTRTREASTTVRDRLLAPYERRLTPAFRSLFRRALSDGMVSSAEAHELLRALEKQNRLKAEERARLAGLIETWGRRAA